MVILSGITSSGTRDPLEEWDSAGKYQPIDEKSTPGPAHGSGFRLARSKCAKKNPPNGNNISPNPLFYNSQLFKTFKYKSIIKMKNKPDPAFFSSFISIQLNK
jgi:hypothetical protein